MHPTLVLEEICRNQDLLMDASDVGGGRNLAETSESHHPLVQRHFHSKKRPKTCPSRLFGAAGSGTIDVSEIPRSADPRKMERDQRGRRSQKSRAVFRA